MEVIRSLLLATNIGQREALMLALLLLFVPAIPFLTARIRSGLKPTLREILGFSALKGFIGQAMETGQPVHVSIGVEGVAGTQTAQTLAGLFALRYLADQAAKYGGAPVVSVADPTAFLAAQDEVRHAFRAGGETNRLNLSQIRMIAPDATAYAAGVMGLLSRESVLSNTMLGAFGDEYLLMSETATRKRIKQVVGTATATTLPFAYVSSEDAILGEEVFAAGAYLSGIPAHLASLLAQDWVRMVIVLAIIVGVILKTVR
jgi:hypothetical protein